VIVIGSGIGGTTTASLLAQSKDKLKILLLEHHTIGGGCCHTFKYRGYTFPTGIHYIGDLNKGSDSLQGILDALAPQDDPLLWDQIYPIANNFDTIVLGSGNDIQSYMIV